MPVFYAMVGGVNSIWLYGGVLRRFLNDWKQVFLMERKKATDIEWVECNQNLIERRAAATHSDDNRALPNPIRDYHLHMKKVFVGDSVLDVGAGSMFLKGCLPDGTKYYPIDPWPQSDEVRKLAIEDIDISESYDTVCAMACLDMCRDFDKAIENMKAVARKNVVILTGLDIERDRYHTFKLTLADYMIRFNEWQMGYCEFFEPKVALLEFIKPPYLKIVHGTQIYKP